MHTQFNTHKNYQGDVACVRREFLPEKAKKVVNKKDTALAYGEVTGHSHQITEGEIEFYELDGTAWLKVLVPSLLTHEEHKPVKLDPGIYEYGTIREFDYETMEARKVLD